MCRHILQYNPISVNRLIYRLWRYQSNHQPRSTLVAMETARSAVEGEGAICVPVLNNNYKHIPPSELSEELPLGGFRRFLCIVELHNVGHIDKHINNSLILNRTVLYFQTKI